LFVAGLALAGCPDETAESESGSEPTEITSSRPEGSSTSNGSEEPAPETKIEIVALAKEALDGKRPDASYSGTGLAVEAWVFTVPEAWDTSTTDDVELAKAGDGQSRFGAARSGSDVIGALELGDCRWSDEEEVRLGAGEIPAKVADGVCMRKDTPVRTIRAVIDGEGKGLVAIGGWDDGSDDENVLETFRSLEKAKPIAACCSALSGNAANAPPPQKPFYAAALVVCQSLVRSKAGREALAQVRSKLPGVPVPGECR
jgi:hypothetical protein